VYQYLMTEVSMGEGDGESLGTVATPEGSNLPGSRGGVLGEIAWRKDFECTRSPKGIVRFWSRWRASPYGEIQWPPP